MKYKDVDVKKVKINEKYDPTKFASFHHLKIDRNDPDEVSCIRYSREGASRKNNLGPSGVRALPLAAGINVGGHYFW